MKRARRHRRVRGFTLLELMVVVVIIGIVIAGAILSLGSSGRDGGLEQESDRLTALISYVRERGSMMTLEYGIRCGQHGYRFVYYDNLTMQWLPETLDDTLRMRNLPAGLDLQLVIEGHQIVLDDKALKFDANAAQAATAMAYPGQAPTQSQRQTLGLGQVQNQDPGQGPGQSSTLGAPSGLGAPPATDNAPQIMLLSDGDTNSFALTIERPSTHRSVTIRSAADGSVQAGKIVQEQQ
ncbi:MAG: type II secretion system minor pseudopilin GspH [Steroidobacteraceae bacterium]